MHCHLYRVRRRQRENGDTNGHGRSRKTLLDKSILESFPGVTYTEEDAEADKLAEKVVYVLSDQNDVDPSGIPLPPSTAPSVRSLSINEEVVMEKAEGESSSMAAQHDDHMESDSMVLQDNEGNLTVMEQSGESKVMYTIPHAQLIIPTCAVCLEDFEPGDLLRELPCGHRYHTDCIDPWLTEKSSACPMCKADFYRPVEVKEEAESAEEDATPASTSQEVAANVVRRRSRRGWFRRMTNAQDHNNIFFRYVARRRQERRQRRQQREAGETFVNVDTQAAEGERNV